MTSLLRPPADSRPWAKLLELLIVILVAVLALTVTPLAHAEQGETEPAAEQSVVQITKVTPESLTLGETNFPSSSTDTPVASEVHVSGEINLPRETKSASKRGAQSVDDKTIDAVLKVYFSAQTATSYSEILNWLGLRGNWQFGYQTLVKETKIRGLKPGQSTHFEITIPLSSLPAMRTNTWGARGFQVNLQDQKGGVLGIARSLIMELPNSKISRQQLSVLAPLTLSTPMLTSLLKRSNVSGDLLAGAAPTSNVEDLSEPLSSLVSLVNGASEAGLNWIIDPALLQSNSVFNSGRWNTFARGKVHSTEPEQPNAEQSNSKQTDSGGSATEEKMAGREKTGSGSSDVETSVVETDDKDTDPDGVDQGDTHQGVSTQNEADKVGNDPLVASWVGAVKNSLSAGSSVLLGPWGLSEKHLVQDQWYESALAQATRVKAALKSQDVQVSGVDGLGAFADIADQTDQVLATLLGDTSADKDYLNTQLARAYVALKANKPSFEPLQIRLAVNAVQSERIRVRIREILADPWVQPAQVTANPAEIDQLADAKIGAGKANYSKLTTVKAQPVEQDKAPFIAAQHYCDALSQASSDFDVVCAPLEAFALLTASSAYSAPAMLYVSESATSAAATASTSGAVTAPDGSPTEVAALLNGHVRQLREAVQVQKSAQINMLSSKADLPVKVASRLPIPLRVQVKAVPRGAALVAKTVSEINLAPGGGFTAKLPIEAKTNGRTEVKVYVGVKTGSDFYQFGSERKVRVLIRASWEDNIFFATSALLLVVLVYGVVCSLRKGRKYALKDG